MILTLLRLYPLNLLSRGSFQEDNLSKWKNISTKYDPEPEQPEVTSYGRGTILNPSAAFITHYTDSSSWVSQGHPLYRVSTFGTIYFGVMTQTNGQTKTSMQRTHKYKQDSKQKIHKQTNIQSIKQITNKQTGVCKSTFPRPSPSERTITIIITTRTRTIITITELVLVSIGRHSYLLPLCPSSKPRGWN